MSIVEMSEKERYQRYLAGREWGLLKAQVKARSGGICERCRLNPSDAVHHLTYERKYNERLEDLQDICDPCHQYTHGKSHHDPRGHPGFLSGQLKTHGWLFLFFVKGDGTLPDDECIWRAPAWDLYETARMLGMTPEGFAGDTIFFSHFVGRPYLIRLHPSEFAETGSWIHSFEPHAGCKETMPVRLCNRIFSFSVGVEASHWCCWKPDQEERS